jgi:Ca-activated chloride channel family protein
MKLARDARASGITVSTLGIGTEFNEKLLVDVADASMGNAYFARVPQEIPPAFGKELAAVQSITLRDVQIETKLSTDVELRRAYRVRPVIATSRGARRDGRTVTIPVGDLDPTNPPALLMEMVVPPQAGGTFRIARLSASYSGQDGTRAMGGASDVVLRYSLTKRREEPNPLVMNTVERVIAYTLQTRALDEMAAGNVAGATRNLRAAATRLLALGEVELARAAEGEAARLDQGGQVSPEGAKELRYATRRLTQRLD